MKKIITLSIFFLKLLHTMQSDKCHWVESHRMANIFTELTKESAVRFDSIVKEKGSNHTISIKIKPMYPFFKYGNNVKAFFKNLKQEEKMAQIFLQSTEKNIYNYETFFSVFNNNIKKDNEGFFKPTLKFDLYLIKEAELIHPIFDIDIKLNNNPQNQEHNKLSHDLKELIKITPIEIEIIQGELEKSDNEKYYHYENELKKAKTERNSQEVNESKKA